MPEELPAGLTLRPPTGADHGRVIAVLDGWWGGLGGEAGALQRRLLLPRLFSDHFTDTSFVVDDGAEVAAFLVGFLSPARPDEAYVHFVGVSPGLRGKGLGGLLYRRFFAVVAGRGRRVVQVDYDGPGIDRVAFRRRLP